MPEPGEYPIDTAEDVLYRSDAMRATEKIIEDEFVEKKLDLDNFPLWSIGTKTIKLTFFRPEDVVIMSNLFEAEVCKYLRSIPPCRHSSETYLKVGQARMIFYANLRRALGTNERSRINERIALLSQIKQLITTGTESKGGRGFLKRLFRLK